MSDDFDTLRQVLDKICERDERYQREAYPFVIEAVQTVAKGISELDPEMGKQISGLELAFGVRDLALKRFGPMAFMVFAEWGIHTTDDIGAMVYNLIDAGQLGKSGSDNIEVFDDLYDFRETFVKPFEP